MKRRDAIKNLYTAPPEPEKLAVANTRAVVENPPERVLAGPVRTMGLALGRLEEESRALQDALASGASVVELEPEHIESSFVRDRLEDSGTGYEEFRRSIAERGQEVPILVRPHPDKAGRYQVAYGHRRLRAVAELGRRVRALVRTMSDAELVVAQGIENSARQDLTYIEKALFARRLEDRGFERTVIMDALSTDKGELSKLISVARAIPEELVQAVGPAPKAGRRRWLALAELLSDAACAASALRMARDPDLAVLDSDTRFVRVLGAAAPRPAARERPTAWQSDGGVTRARISRAGSTVTLAIERDPAFGEFIASRLDDLYAAYRRDTDSSSASSGPGRDGSGVREN